MTGRRGRGHRASRANMTGSIFRLFSEKGFAGREESKWHVKFTRVTPLDGPQANYEWKWASLAFEVRRPSFAAPAKKEGRRGARRDGPPFSSASVPAYFSFAFCFTASTASRTGLPWSVAVTSSSVATARSLPPSTWKRPWSLTW